MAFIGNGAQLTDLDAGDISTGTLGVARGGTGAATLTANNVLLGNGTSAVQFVAPGSSGNVLTSNGTTWSSTAPASTAPTTAQVLSAYAGATGNAVGTYAFVLMYVITGGVPAFGSTYAGGGSGNQVQLAAIRQAEGYIYPANSSASLSGTWRWLASNGGDFPYGIALRVS